MLKKFGVCGRKNAIEAHKASWIIRRSFIMLKPGDLQHCGMQRIGIRHKVVFNELYRFPLKVSQYGVSFVYPPFSTIKNALRYSHSLL
jgi:hypothetical protein